MMVMRRLGLYGGVLAAALVAMSGLPSPGEAALTSGTLGQSAVRTPLGAGGALSSGTHVQRLLARVGVEAPILFNVLNGVFCTARANCWAVGETHSGNAFLNQMLHYNGKTWRTFPVPNPGGTGADDMSSLSAVRCLTARNCWAVGDYGNGIASKAEALHWNGRKWSSVAVPAPGGTRHGDVNELFDSTCTSAKNCWAVGDFGSANGLAQRRLNFVLHWNGKRWSRVRFINPGGVTANHVNELFAVRCLAPANCLAVGEAGTTSASSSYVLRNEAMRWNGKKWSVVRTPNPGGTKFGHFSQLDALACAGPASCWGAGLAGSNEPTKTSLNQILHWNGKRWTHAVAPNPNGTKLGANNELIGAVCNSSVDCWAIGDYDNKFGADLSEALHWNGKRWSLKSTPSPAGTALGDTSILFAARCTSSANCWAVGIYGSPFVHRFNNLILHWNGKKWSTP
jgi:hypothetical protein